MCAEKGGGRRKYKLALEDFIINFVSSPLYHWIFTLQSSRATTLLCANCVSSWNFQFVTEICKIETILTTWLSAIISPPVSIFLFIRELLLLRLLKMGHSMSATWWTACQRFCWNFAYNLGYEKNLDPEDERSETSEAGVMAPENFRYLEISRTASIFQIALTFLF